jgi:hypothetical protein
MSSNRTDTYTLSSDEKVNLSELSNLMLSIINYNKDQSQFNIWINDPNQINKSVENLSALSIAILEMDNHKSIDLIRRLLEAGEKITQTYPYVNTSHVMCKALYIKDNALMQEVIQLLITYDTKYDHKHYYATLLIGCVRQKKADVNKFTIIYAMENSIETDVVKEIFWIAINNKYFEICEIILRDLIEDDSKIELFSHVGSSISMFLYWQNQKLLKKVETLEKNQNLKRYIQDKIPPIEAMIIDYANQQS